MGLRRTFNMLRNLKNWDSYLLYKLGGRVNDSFTFRLRNNFLVHVPKQILPEFKESFFEETYLAYLPSKILDIESPIILDIGANVGFFSIFSFYKFKNPKIISFEPIKRNFDLLQNNVNLISSNNLIIVNKAVSKTNGQITLTFSNDQDITTSASIFDNQSESIKETVISTSLEKIVEDYKLSKIDLLKLDCEGAEYEIFYNTPSHIFKKVNCIALETHQGKSENENNMVLSNYLRKLGFTVKTKADDLIWAYKDVQQWNNGLME
jgi:FkbM family methyltransferase